MNQHGSGHVSNLPDAAFSNAVLMVGIDTYNGEALSVDLAGTAPCVGGKNAIVCMIVLNMNIH
jgi:hypothetical protein